MTPLPKKKHSRARTNKRKNAATNRYRLPQVVTCASCKKFKLPHMACPHCDYYKTQSATK